MFAEYRLGASRALPGGPSGGSGSDSDDFELAVTPGKRHAGSGSGRAAPTRPPLPAPSYVRKPLQEKPRQPPAVKQQQKQQRQQKQQQQQQKQPQQQPQKEKQRPHQQPQQQRQRRQPAGDSSDEEEFVAGSLKQAPVKQAPQPQPEIAAGPGSAKQKQKQHRKAAAGGGYGLGVDVIRLDTLPADRWPGWQASVQGVAQVAAFQPSPAPVAALTAGGGGAAQPLHPAGEGGRLELVPDLLRFDLSRLGSGFQGVLVNAGPASLARLVAGSWRLPRALGGSGLLFVWASKAQVAAGVRLMSASGFSYVENLTHLLLGPGGHPLQDPAALFSRSHSTLLIGRRSSSGDHLELRHQRTPDVIASPTLPDGSCPPAVFAAIETLLPDASGPRAGGRLRLLELAFAPAGSSSGAVARRRRPGWLTLLQQGWPDDA